MIQILEKAPLPFLGTEVHTLPNGLTIILKQDSTIPVVALQMWARCGSINETPRINGISHGLEHMVFKGTPHRSAGQITRSIESHGGSINAATQLETTHYYIDIPSYGTLPALEVLADTLTHPTFPQNELEKERLVILEEIHRREDNPDAVLWDLFSSEMFSGTPYGMKVIGSVESVSNMSQKDLFEYFREYYVPSNLFLVITGDFKTKIILQEIYKLFGNIKAQKRPPQPQVKLNGFKPIHKKVSKPLQLSYLGMGLPSAGLSHADTVQLDVLADVLGGGASSRLYQNVREKRKACLNISCDYVAFQQQGIFSIFAEAMPGQTDKTVEAILDELKQVLSDPFSIEELNRAKSRIKSDWLFGSETPHGMASNLGTLGTLGRLDLITDYLSGVEVITITDLKKTFDTYLAGKTFSVCALGPS